MVDGGQPVYERVAIADARVVHQERLGVSDARSRDHRSLGACVHRAVQVRAGLRSRSADRPIRAASRRVDTPVPNIAPGPVPHVRGSARPDQEPAEMSTQLV